MVEGGGGKIHPPPSHTHTHTHTDTQSYSYYIKVKKNLPSCDHTFQKSYISLAFFRSITLLFFRLSIMFTFFKSNKARIFKGSCFWGMSISCLINLSRRTNPILMQLDTFFKQTFKIKLKLKHCRHDLFNSDVISFYAKSKCQRSGKTDKNC